MYAGKEEKEKGKRKTSNIHLLHSNRQDAYPWMDPKGNVGQRHHHQPDAMGTRKGEGSGRQTTSTVQYYGTYINILLLV